VDVVVLVPSGMVDEVQKRRATDDRQPHPQQNQSEVPDHTDHVLDGLPDSKPASACAAEASAAAKHNNRVSAGLGGV